MQERRDNGWYRRWFSTLHPSLQLVLLQLWMPVFFIVMFCLCYVAAFHAPSVHDAPVGVVGEATLPLSENAAISVDPTGFDTAAEAKAAVVHGTVAAAYDPSSTTLYVASAHQMQAATLMEKLLLPALSTDRNLSR